MLVVKNNKTKPGTDEYRMKKQSVGKFMIFQPVVVMMSVR